METQMKQNYFVPVKESGVGQTSFIIIPRQIGLLPYPSVYIHHQCNPDFNEKDSISDTTALGERLLSYHRLGKQQKIQRHNEIHQQLVQFDKR
uniref:Uncharacterized protein n=1 Tax=Panagrolaimus sp. PS1159 TaxID=55785 RepID=A0AC35FLZ3_9BILA